METKISIGQRRIFTKSLIVVYPGYKRKHSTVITRGMKGTIIDANVDSMGCVDYVLIEFDDYIGSLIINNCAKGKDGHCLWIPKGIVLENSRVHKRKNNY